MKALEDDGEASGMEVVRKQSEIARLERELANERALREDVELQLAESATQLQTATKKVQIMTEAAHEYQRSVDQLEQSETV